MTVDGMEPFVKATYALEGDGVLALVAYERISALHSNIVASHHPNVTAVAKHVANGSTTNEQMLLTYAENCVKPAYDYFKEKFDNDLRMWNYSRRQDTPPRLKCQNLHLRAVT